jgi:SHS2 domain-containing protein
MVEVFEHTADIGLRVRAAELPELFSEAARGLFGLIVENLDEVQPTQAVQIHVDGTEREYLLFDWLNELLFRFDTQHFVCSKFKVEITSTGLDAEVRGEPLDPGRHVLDHEVKAITYHDLKVEQTPDGWLAEVILDI